MTYTAEVLADSPLAYYRLGEASGLTLVDSSGNGHGGTYNAAPTFGQPGLVGDTDTAVAFSGAATSYASTPNAAWMNFASGVTVEAVVNMAAVGDFNLVVTDVFLLAIQSTGKAMFGATHTNGSFSSTGYATGGTLPTATAVHLAGTFDGSTTLLYVNGTQVASHAETGTMLTPTSNLGLATDPSDDTLNYAGVLDEVAVYSHALSAARIAAHAAYATGGGTPPPPPPTAGTSTTNGGNGIRLTGSATVDVQAPLEADPPNLTTVPIRIITPTVPAPTLVNGRPQ